ncbi:MAG: hypothetical protein ACR2P5_09215 [Gammaproteobacteria bacterium]
MFCIFSRQLSPFFLLHSDYSPPINANGGRRGVGCGREIENSGREIKKYHVEIKNIMSFLRKQESSPAAQAAPFAVCAASFRFAERSGFLLSQE